MKTINSVGNISQVEMSMNATMLCDTGEVSAYEAPTTSRTVVETEGSFCGSVTDDTNSSSDVNTTNQQVQTDYFEQTSDGGSKNPFDFSDTDNWD